MLHIEELVSTPHCCVTGAGVVLQGMQEAEKRSQTQLEALQAERQSTAERLHAAQSESQAIAAQVQKLQADKQAATQEVQTMREEVQTVHQRLQATDADKAAAAKQLQESRLALQKERAEWQQQREEWEAERKAKAEREKQLQHDMAAMQAMLEEYKAVLQSSTRVEHGRTEAGTASMSQAQASGQLREKLERPSTAVPLTPGNTHDASSSEDTARPRLPQQQTPAAAGLSSGVAKRAIANKALSPDVDAGTPVQTVLELFGSASGTVCKFQGSLGSQSRCGVQAGLRSSSSMPLKAAWSCMPKCISLSRCVWVLCVCVCGRNVTALTETSWSSKAQLCLCCWP